MRAGQPSRTARQNALFRALEAGRPPADRVADDPLAIKFLTPEFRALAVTNYLDPASVDATFQFLASAIASGSPVLFTYVDRAMLDGSAVFEGAATTLRAVRRVGEPITFGLNPKEVPGYLSDRGFEMESDTVVVRDAAERFYPAGASPSAPAYYHVVESRRV